MKKGFLLVILSIAFFIIPNNLEAEVSTYKVYVLNSNNEKLEEVEFNNYNDALTKMNSYPKDIDNVPVIEKNGVIVNAKYAVAKLKGFIYVYDRADLRGDNTTYHIGAYTYIAGDYGVDAAFLGYDDINNTVNIKISGYSGWTKLDSIEIIPLSKISVNYITINVSDAVLKSSADINSTSKKYLQENGPYIWVEKKEVNGVTWYHIQEYGTDGWINNNEEKTKITEVKMPNINTFYVSFNSENVTKPFDLYHYYAYRGEGIEKYNYLNLGKSPSILKKYKYYYSFDGNYFYEDYLTMIDDYKNNVYTNSINPTSPYFNYYMYLPNHSKTGYTAENFNQIIKNAGFTSGPDKTLTYVNANGTWTNVSRANISMMYGEGESFIESQETYGVNALLTFSAAINESATGTSAIAFAKNNIFGHNATDSNPFLNATTYSSVRESILTHASKYATGYSNPSDYRYFGSHYGNKGSGMGVNYASDPYWGEKAAANAYNRDYIYGGQDYLSNTIGVKLIEMEIPIKKEASDDSDTIYTIKNNNRLGSTFLIKNIPFIVFDKVVVDNISWYKVYTDTSLDDNRNIADVSYSFSKSYGYIKEEYLYVSNSQPVITANDVRIEQGEAYDFRTNVTALDKEDGNLTDKIKFDNIQTNVDGVFYLTYTVTDSMNFSSSKTIKVTIYKSNKPVITASNKDILQNTSFNPMDGVSVIDPNEGDITNRVIIENGVDITKVGSYKVKYIITNSMNITISKEVTINVLSNALPIIRATDIYMNIDDNLTYLENVSARDLEDGLLNDKIKISHNIDKTKVGNYSLTYEVTDSNNNKVNKTINVYVLSDNYTSKTGELYFNSLSYNTETNLLDVSGSLAIIGIDNTKDIDIKYDLILKNNISNNEIILPLERYLDNHPTTVYGDNTHTYTETWFKGSVSLKDVVKGEYTLYVRARSGNFESKVLFNNIFLKPMTKKATDSDGRGYLFRNNNYSKEFSIELFIYENGLISTAEPPSTANMFNNYSSVELKSKYLKIVGNSFNMNGDYNKDSNITRYLIFEEIATEKRYQYNIGSIIGEELVLRNNDGLSKARSWYDTKELVDVSILPKGRYIIYLRTSNSKVDDFGELQDIFLKTTDSVTIDTKMYSLIVNKKNRFRVELLVE